MPLDMCNHNERRRAVDGRRWKSGEGHQEAGADGVIRHTNMLLVNCMRRDL